jgi:hypothetical protein
MPDTVTVEEVAEWLGKPIAETEQCQLAIDAELAAIARTHNLPPVDADGVAIDPWPADFKLGVIMAVARLRKRPESPAGTVTFDGFAERVSAYDPDITRLLGDQEIIRFG